MGVICASCGDDIGIARSYVLPFDGFPPGVTLHYGTGCYGRWCSQPTEVRHDRLVELARMGLAIGGVLGKEGDR